MAIFALAGLLGMGAADAAEPLLLGSEGKKAFCWALPIGSEARAALTPEHCAKGGRSLLFSMEGEERAWTVAVAARNPKKDWAILALGGRSSKSPLRWEDLFGGSIGSGWIGEGKTLEGAFRVQATSPAAGSVWAKASRPLCRGDSGAIVFPEGEKKAAAMLISGQGGECSREVVLLPLSEIPWSYWLD